MIKVNLERYLTHPNPYFRNFIKWSLKDPYIISPDYPLTYLGSYEYIDDNFAHLFKIKDVYLDFSDDCVEERKILYISLSYWTPPEILENIYLIYTSDLGQPSNYREIYPELSYIKYFWNLYQNIANITSRKNLNEISNILSIPGEINAISLLKEIKILEPDLKEDQKAAFLEKYQDNLDIFREEA